MAKIDIRNLPKPARIAIAIVPTIVFVVAFVFLAVIPKNKQIESLRQEIAKQENDIAKSQSMAGKLETLKVENEKLRKRLKELEEHLPEEKEISPLLKQVSDLGIKAGLQIISWKPADRRKHKSGIVYEVPVAVSLIGSYHKLGKFFSSLTELDRIVNISNIKLTNPVLKRDEVILRVSFSAVTFTAAEEEEKAKGKPRGRAR
jgi:type IV pilus assembly protein PilO